MFARKSFDSAIPNLLLKIVQRAPLRKQKKINS